MPKQARNTKRGSHVRHAAEQVQQAVEAAIAARAANPALALTLLASQHGCPYFVLWRRWKRYAAARDAGDIAGMVEASVSHRGGHNRAFTLAQEAVLRESVLAAAPAMGAEQIREAALQLHRDAEVAAGLARGVRARRRFSASNGFITDFKRRNRLSSHRTALYHVSQHEMAGRDIEAESLAYVTEVRSAVLAYGERMVFNMDETPVSLLDVPTTGIVRTGSKLAARLTTTENTGTKITTFPCITAAGDKLQMCAIIKGKTARSLRKITDGASPAIRSVRLFTSQSGWVHEAIMLQWLRDVVLPHTGGRPAALILDSFRAHWTYAVRVAAMRMQLELIQVPPGCTATLQPLDVSFNGPMLKARQAIWLKHKLAFPEGRDSQQRAVERAQLAYASISKAATRSAWSKASLID